MKIVLISDLHFGVRSDNTVLLNYYKRFLDDVFFPYLEEHKIETVIIPGDLLDKRKSVSILTAKRLREDFLEPLKGYDVHIIAGNHDTVMKNTNEINSLTELLRGYGDDLHIYIDPTEVQIGGLKMLMLPWICPENEGESLAAIKSTKAPICIAHLELKGIELRKGKLSEAGMAIDTFSKFDLVLTGHYHGKTNYQNIHYLGSCFEMTWGDYGYKRGFHIFDTETRELTLIENPYKMFYKLTYNDERTTLEKLLNGVDERMKNSFVKVIVSSKTNIGWFDQFIRKIEELPVYDVSVVDEDSLVINLDNDDDLIDQAESTLEMLSKSLEYYDIEKVYKKDLNKLLEDLYKEAHVLNA